MHRCLNGGQPYPGRGSWVRLLANSIVAGAARLCPAACFSDSRLLLHEADRLNAMPYIMGVAVSKLPAKRSCFLGERFLHCKALLPRLLYVVLIMFEMFARPATRIVKNDEPVTRAKSEAWHRASERCFHASEWVWVGGHVFASCCPAAPQRPSSGGDS